MPSKCAEAKKVLTTTPKLMKQIVKEAGLEKTCYDYFKPMIDRGAIIRGGTRGSFVYSIPSEHQDGSFTRQLLQAASKLEDEGYFEHAAEDERDRRFREIAQRRGQQRFRRKLIAAYGCRCAITGCDALGALEAAHIVPYLGPKSNHESNGLLLRADIHTLFDLDLIGIDPESRTVAVAEQLRDTYYWKMNGRELNRPNNDAQAPNKKELQQRWETFNCT